MFEKPKKYPLNTIKFGKSPNLAWLKPQYKKKIVLMTVKVTDEAFQ